MLKTKLPFCVVKVRWFMQFSQLVNRFARQNIFSRGKPLGKYWAQHSLLLIIIIIIVIIGEVRILYKEALALPANHLSYANDDAVQCSHNDE